jgi:DNA-binding transcriptional ArsR family regulator
MIEFVLDDPDLLGVRFAISPLNELTLSLRALRDPGRYPLHLRWIRTVLDGDDSIDRRLLLALTNDRGWTPDFLSPRPGSPLTRIDDELAEIRRTPAAVVRRDLRAIHPAVPAVLAGPNAPARIAAALDAYWRFAFSQHWPRMRALLEADVMYRGREMTQAGLGAMLTGISDRVTFESPVVRVRITGAPARRIQVRGAGLTLLPSLFALRTAVPVDPDVPPQLIYAARGVATLWESRPRTARSGLAGILGRVRADLLAGLDEPVSSTRLANRLGVTPSAVNQHLRALRDAGLLASSRHGRSVLYVRTELGDTLLDAPPPYKRRANEVSS